MGILLSLNLGQGRASEHTDAVATGIDKRPVTGPVEVRAPGPKGTGASGLIGDDVCDLRHHGGEDQAVYGYAREDLDHWQAELGRPLANGVFGENLTTVGLDQTGAVIGERWQVGAQVVLEVSVPRLPCATFAGWMGEKHWVKRFTRYGATGAYFRVIRGGRITAGEEITVLSRPDHGVTIGMTFRAVTTEAELLPRLLDAPQLPGEVLDIARQRLRSRSPQLRNVAS